jgi:hypothetical protein
MALSSRPVLGASAMSTPSKKTNGARKQKSESLREIYARHKREFTAADLQKYTEIDEVTVPLADVINEMKATQLKYDRKRKKR